MNQHRVAPIVQKGMAVSKKEGHKGIHLATLESYLRESGWVDRVALYHVLPWTLVIKLSMREPIAMWQSRKEEMSAVQWVDRKGTVFNAASSINAAGIPLLIGNHEQLHELLGYQKGLDSLLRPHSLSVASVQLDDDKRCVVNLKNGIQLLFGHFNPYKQLQQLLWVNPSLLHQTDKVAILDLRYQRGMAITWRTVTV